MVFRVYFIGYFQIYNYNISMILFLSRKNNNINNPDKDDKVFKQNHLNLKHV